MRDYRLGRVQWLAMGAFAQAPDFTLQGDEIRKYLFDVGLGRDAARIIKTLMGKGCVDWSPDCDTYRATEYGLSGKCETRQSPTPLFVRLQLRRDLSS